MTIPEIRRRLHALAEELGLQELAELAEATRRRPPLRKASVESNPMTPREAEQIRQFAEAYPSLSQMHIADRFGVNIGRVSEALFGKRS